MNQISPMAFVDPEAKLGDNNIIGPFCYIDKNTVIGDNNKFYNSVTVHAGARIGNNNEFFPGASISTKPQDLKYRGEDTLCEIGDNNSVRENVTISRGTASKGTTIVGSNNLLMENMHVAHDCVLGNGLIIGNSTKFAGEVDIPPYIIAGKEPTRYCGINIVGLRRRGFSNETIDIIHDTYRTIYANGIIKDGIQEARAKYPGVKEVEYICSFIENSKRGIIR